MPRFVGVAHIHSTYSFDGKVKLSEIIGRAYECIFICCIIIGID